MKGNFVPELPCERLIRKICGSQWRNLPKHEIDAAWGIAIVRSILDGVSLSPGEVASHLGTDTGTIHDAYDRLHQNGVLRRAWLDNDRNVLNSDDLLAWGYYGGYACGATSR